MKAKIIFFFFLLLIIIAGVLFFNMNKFFPEKKIHYHAGFQIYVDGEKIDFSDAKYMDLTPCTGHEENEDDQQEKAHLHENVGDIVHVHREKAKWSDLFNNIGFKIDKTKTIEGYINGKKITNVLDYPIKPYDSLVLLIGSHGSIDNYLSRSVTVQHIKQTEKTSELCGS